MLVSILIITYNRKDSLVRCIESILKQGEKDIEIIVVDDASSDGTPTILKNKFPDVIVKSNPTPLFPCKSLQAGLDVCSGKYVVKIDDDNILLPRALDKLIETISSDDCIAFCGAVCVDTNYHVINGGYRISKYLKRGMSNNGTPLNLLQARIYDVDFVDNVYVFNRDLIIRYGGFSKYCESFVWGMEDAIVQLILRRAGYRIVCNPNAVALHDRSARHINATQMYYLSRGKIVMLTRVYDVRFILLPFFSLFYATTYFIGVFISTKNISELKNATVAICHGLLDGFKEQNFGRFEF